MISNEEPFYIIQNLDWISGGGERKDGEKKKKIEKRKEKKFNGEWLRAGGGGDSDSDSRADTA